MVGRMSISGVQPKLSVIHDQRKHQVSVVERGGLYILKPPTERFESIPENENLCMNIASHLRDRGSTAWPSPAHGRQACVSGPAI